jgi:hypothetical protein
MLYGRACEWRVVWGARTIPTSCRPGQMNPVMLPGKQCCINNRQCKACLLSCCICMVCGCDAMKIGWVGWVGAMKNWWFRHCCGAVHDCPQFFPMLVDLLFGDISMYPHYTKKQPLSRHNLRLPPWHNIARICIGFKLEEHIWIQNGGVHQLQCSFLIWNIVHDVCLAMKTPSQKVGVHLILYFKVESI